MVKAELSNHQNQAHRLAYQRPDRWQEEGPLVFRRNNVALQYATAEAETAWDWWSTMLRKPTITWASCDISSDATGHCQITQGAQDWFIALKMTPTITKCTGRKQVLKADCNLAFICIFKLVRLWTVAKQWQRIFIIISLVGWGGGVGRGRQRIALPHHFTRKKNTIQHFRSPELIMISWSPLTLWTKTGSPNSQLNMQVCICPPLLGLTPPPPTLHCFSS